MKEYLQLTRAHTAPQEMVPAMSGAVLATGGLFNWHIAIWGVVGLLYHLAGYGMNSMMDYWNGWDQDDPYKSHHPMNDGRVTDKQASVVVAVLFVAVIVLSLLFSLGHTYAIYAIYIGAASGVLYNMVGKSLSALKPISISIAHTSMFAIPFLASGGRINSGIFYFGCILVFSWVFFQIAYSGEIMGIENDEKGLIRDLGVEYHSGMHDHGFISFSLKSIVLAVFTRVISIASAVSLFMVLSGNVYSISFVLMFLFMVLMLLNSAKITKAGIYRRDGIVRAVSTSEGCMEMIMLLCLVPVIGFLQSWILMAAVILWVFCLNKIEWGTILSPKV